jgi:hypothetical protein
LPRNLSPDEDPYRHGRRRPGPCHRGQRLVNVKMDEGKLVGGNCLNCRAGAKD